MTTQPLPRPLNGGRVATLRSLCRSWRFWLALGILVVLGFVVSKLVEGYFYPFAEKDAATILVIGADEPEHGHSRSDTMLLVRVQLRPERRVTVLALPRDTRVQIAKHPGDQKLNAAFAFGEETLLRETIAANFGVRPDYTLTLLPAGLAKVVDAAGGIEMNVPMAMNYDDSCQNLHIHLQPGLQHLNGTQAVQFVRFRKDGKGDLGRMDRQKTFLKTVARQSLTLGNFLRWNRITPVLREAIHTDLNDHQLVGLGYSLRGLRPEELHTLMLPGRPQYLHGVSFYQPSVENAQFLLEDQQIAATDRVGGLVPGNGWVVLNGCGRNGYARRAAHQMHASGLKVLRISNVPVEGAYPASELRVAPGTETASLQSQVQHTLGVTAQVIPDDRVPVGVRVLLLGDDFHPAFGTAHR